MSREVALPPRPHVPIPAWCLVVTVVAQRLAMSQDGLAGTIALSLVGCVLLASLAGLLHAAREGWEPDRDELVRASHAVLCACVVCATFAILTGLVARSRMNACSKVLSTTPVSQLDLVVRGDPSPGEWAFSYTADVFEGGHCLGRVMLSCDEELARGSHLRCVGRFAATGGDDWGRTCRERGVCGSVRALSVISVTDPRGALRPVMALRGLLLARLAPGRSEARAVLAGLTLGRRSELSELGLDEDFSRAGLAHLVAVSGAHIAIASAALAMALERLEAPPLLRVSVLAGVGWAYVLLCGMPASALRAWLMSVSAGGAALVGRRGHALSAVGVTGVAMCLLFPGTAGELGFVLSASCVCGLCALGGYASYALEAALPWDPLERLPPRRRRAVAARLDDALSSVASAMVAQASSLPFVAGAFGRVSVLGPVSCLVAGPLFLACMWSGLVSVLLCPFPVVGDALLSVADVPCLALLLWARFVGGLPLACVPVERPAVASVVILLCVVALLVAWPCVSRRGAATIILVAVAPLAAWQLYWALLAPPRIVVLDVGQGDAILVQDGRHALLVDAGPTDGPVATALFRNHVSHLDGILVTHLHDDHYGGIPELVGVVGVDSVLVADGVAEGAARLLSDPMRDLRVPEMTEVGYGDVIRVGRFNMRVVWPREEVDGTENADSVELVVEGDFSGRRLSALLTGDAEQDETGAVVSAGDVGDVDLLKVGHHGSEVSIRLEDAIALDAEVAVASAGEGNPYGHPTPSCVEVLVGSGSAFLCTKDVGDVEVRPGVAGPRVTCQKRCMQIDI